MVITKLVSTTRLIERQSNKERLVYLLNKVTSVPFCKWYFWSTRRWNIMFSQCQAVQVCARLGIESSMETIRYNFNTLNSEIKNKHYFSYLSDQHKDSNKEVFGWKTNKRAHRELWDVLTLTDVFVNQKRVNVCEFLNEFSMCYFYGSFIFFFNKSFAIFC